LVSSQINPGIQAFNRLPVPLEPFLRGREVDAELHQPLAVTRDFQVIARIGVFGQPGEWHVDVATIGQGADGEVMFDGIDNQEHAVSLCRSCDILDLSGRAGVVGRVSKGDLDGVAQCVCGSVHGVFGMKGDSRARVPSASAALQRTSSSVLLRARSRRPSMTA
jgi:hypothetical protein